jgi:NAD(P)-dependent dehydrogenase (short-subunit alcohol dehydrogenase family)
VNSLVGQVVVVTGGSRGLGEQVVRAFAAEGASVVIASRKLEPCVALAESVHAEFGVATLPVDVNVGDWDQCDRLVETVYERFDKVDVLVNNAGMSPLYDDLPSVTEALFDKVMDVNLKGPFRLAVLFGDRMRRDGGGRIINVGSIEAMTPEPDALPYALAKSGVHTLTQGLARAFGPEVRVNTLQPGPFLTDISRAWSPEFTAGLDRRTTLGRCAEPEEIVGAALFLATAASSYTTGTLLRVDGGWS